MLRPFLAVLVLVLVLPAVDALGGARAAVSQKFLDYAIEQTIPFLSKEVKSIQIPSQSGDKDSFDYSVKNIHITDFSVGSAALSFHAPDGLSLKLTGISLAGHLDWSYKEDVWPHVPNGGGNADLSVGGNSYVTGLVEVSLADSHKPQLAISNLNVHLDHLGVTVHGSMFSWLYNLIIDAVNGDIKNAIDGGIKSALQGTLVSMLNSAIEKFAFVQQLPLPKPYDKAEIDFSVLGIAIETDHVAVDIRASVNATDGASPYPATPAELPPASSDLYDMRHVTVDFSSYIVESFAHCLASQGLLYYDVLPSDIPSDVPFHLTTNTLKDFAPGLKQYPGKNMSIRVTAAGPPNITFADNHTHATASAEFGFYILGANLTHPAFVLGCPLTAAASISVDSSSSPEVLHASVLSAECKPLSVVNSTVGDVHRLEIAVIVDLALKIGLPKLNGVIAKGLPIPTEEGVSLVDSLLFTRDGLLTFATDVKLDLPHSF